MGEDRGYKTDPGTRHTTGVALRPNSSKIAVTTFAGAVRMLLSTKADSSFALCVSAVDRGLDDPTAVSCVRVARSNRSEEVAPHVLLCCYAHLRLLDVAFLRAFPKGSEQLLALW